MALFAFVVLAVFAGASRCWAQSIATAEIKTVQLQPDLYLLRGYGGNVLQRCHAAACIRATATVRSLPV